ncbi:squalene synthase HpnC [Streptomyces sp. 4N509B]|uniref:squalene synthase HpnC n=1 Tax=Streptomyces sp. 4N509B TaxID=3457413 RepID=UPI003FD4844E
MTVMSDTERQARELLAKSFRENFPVAPRFLPRAWREDLTAVYGYARLVDDIGDGDLTHAPVHAAFLGLDPGAAPAPSGAAGGAPAPLDPPPSPDRPASLEPPALLDALEADLRRVFASAHGGPAPRHPLLRDLVPTVRRTGLGPKPFLDLLAANRLDQHHRRYATHDELLRYCELSANPVGHLVLAVTGTTTPARRRLSDAVCTALQIVEHLQDVAEDLARDRVYLPAADMRRFRVTTADLAAPTATTAVRTLVAHLAARARRLLAAGASLVGTVRGRLRLLLAGFVGGGRAAIRAIADAGYDVLAGPPRATRRGLLYATGTTLAQALGAAPGR